MNGNGILSSLKLFISKYNKLINLFFFDMFYCYCITGILLLINVINSKIDECICILMNGYD